jgi:methionine sulfoxide reductase heme-binding subunit
VNTVVASSPSRAPLGALKGWRLFWVLAVATSVIELLAWQAIDWRSGSDVRLLIGFNWRLSAPYFLLAFTASALQQLFPSALTRWLLANRRYLGLAFASVAGWQLVTIVFLGTHFRAELEDIHSDSFQYVEDLIFVTLVLMTVTSFRPVSRHMRLATWRRLHSTGIYLLGGLFTVNFLYFTVTATDATYLAIMSAFVVGWALRAAVWWRRRATFQQWKLFWALFGFANAAVLGTWSYFGLQTDEHLRYVTAVCVALTCLFFLAALAAPSLNRLWPSAATARLLAGRRYYLLAGLLSLGWYLAFMTVRAGKPLTPGAPPLPLSAGVSVAIAAVGLVLFALARAERGTESRGTPYLRAGRIAQWITPVALGALLTGGLLATRHETLSAVLSVACVTAWVAALCAALRPAHTLAPATLPAAE